MATTNDLKNGMTLNIDGQLWNVVEFQHVKPGKGGAFAQVELRNLRNGSKLNERFRSADKVERVRLEQKDQQFLYENDGMLVFMDTDTYEQIELPVEKPKDNKKKRTRIKKQGPGAATPAQNDPKNRNNTRGPQKKGPAAGRGRKQPVVAKQELTDEQIQKQINLLMG